MFLYHFCLAFLVGYAPAHFKQQECAAGVDRAALFAILSECEFPEDELRGSFQASVKKLYRQERLSKYWRLLREFAHGARLAAPSKMLPLKWADHWKTCCDRAGANQLRCCRGPPDLDRGLFSHNQSSDPGGGVFAGAHHESKMKIESEESEPC